MKVSAAGRAAIEQREGRRLSAYRDSRGIWTIGVGHAATGLPPKPHAGMIITEAECDALLAADLAPVEAVINTAVKVPIGQNEFDALASLGFNIGTGGLRSSSVIRKLNTGDIAGAANAFMNWCKPAVLTGRREEERKQFLEPDPVDAATGVSGSHAIAGARSSALAAKAAKAKTKAKVTTGGGAAVAVVGAATAVASGGHHHLAWIAGSLAALSLAIDGLVTIAHRQTAATLSANASAQAASAIKLSQPAAALTPAKAS